MFIDTIRNLFIFKEYNFISLMKITKNLQECKSASDRELGRNPYSISIYIYIAYSYRSFVLIPMSLRLKHGSNG